MSFLLLHIIYQITVNSLLAGNSITSDFNCECSVYRQSSYCRVSELVVFCSNVGNSTDQSKNLNWADWLQCLTQLYTRKSDGLESIVYCTPEFQKHSHLCWALLLGPTLHHLFFIFLFFEKCSCFNLSHSSKKRATKAVWHVSRSN